jgi:hypothetical protein
MARTTVLRGASGKEYTFDFGLNAWCRVEAITGKLIGDVFTALDSHTVNARLMRQFFQGTLVGGETLTPEEIGDASDDIGPLAGVLNALGTALKATEPPPAPPPIPTPPAEIH